MVYPNTTGPSLPTKATTYDQSNTANFFNGADWNDLRTLVHALRGQHVGSYRGYCERRSAATLTAVSVHTCTVMADGYRKQIASARVLIPGVTGTVWVYGRANPTGIAGVVRTAAAEPAPYATATRDFPIAKVVITGGTLSVTHVRPDWVLGHAL